MNEDTIADLKQFIAGTVSQQLGETNQKLDDLSASVAEAIDNQSEILESHETRIKQLENS